MKFIFYLFTFLFIVACSTEETVPNDLLQPDKMVAVMEDMYVAEGLVANGSNADKIAERQMAIDYYSIVYKKHQVDSALFRKSFDFYAMHPKLMQQVSDQVIEKLNKKNLELYKK